MTRSFFFGICSLLFLTMSQCNSVKDLSNPNFIGETSYYRTWVAGIQGGGSGLNLYLDIKNIPESITLIEVHFKEKTAPIIFNRGIYSAHFKTDLNNQVDEISPNESLEKTVKTLPDSSKTDLPFKLENDEAIILYKENGTEKYAKINQIENRGHIALPSARGEEFYNH